MFIHTTLKEYLKESLLLEGMTDIVYHFTNFYNLVNILKENIFNASTNIGSSADLKTSKGKFFFFSTTRSKSTGFVTGNVKFVLDGQKLSQKYKSFPIDYWQYSKNRNDYTNDNSYKQALLSGEQEDRIVLDKPTIENATKYIIAIHILLNKNFLKFVYKSDIENIISLCEDKNIPIYFYNNENDWKLQTKNIDPLTLIYKDKNIDEEEYNFTVSKINYSEREIISLLVYNDNKNFDFIIKSLDLTQNYIDVINEQIKKDTYNYFNDKLNTNEYIRKISNNIHNMRSKTTNTARILIKLLADDFKKYEVKNIDDYVKYKIYKKEKISPTIKNKSILWDINSNSEVNWNKRAWNYIQPEDIWNMLPKYYQNDNKFINLINNTDARMDYVYNFLTKNINKEFTNKVFKTASLIVK